ncbi:hypothetical protein ACHAXS_007425 [Conticribra weissflogii]
MNDEGCAVASSAAQKTGMKTEKTQMPRCLQNDLSSSPSPRAGETLHDSNLFDKCFTQLS